MRVMTKVISPVITEGRSTERRVAGSEWVVLAGMGAVFVLVALVDIGLAFYPLNVGSAEWEFGTATALMDNLPVGTVGVGLIGVAGLGKRSEVLVNLAVAFAVLLLIVIVSSAAMFGRNVAEAVRSVTEPLLRQGLQESIARTSIQLVAYLVALGWFVAKLRRGVDK
jgi:hypothetical protein